MSAGGTDSNLVIRVSADTTDATSQIQSLDSTINQAAGDSSNATDAMSSGAASMGANWDKAATSVFSGARHITSGIGGLLAAQDNLYTAQSRVNIAQINYTLTVRQYGEGSIQATRALDQLQIAQNGVTLAQDRMTLKYIQFAITAGPAVYKSIMNAITASGLQSAANYAEIPSWTAKTAAILATAAALGLATFGVSALVGGLAATSSGAIAAQANQQQASSGLGNTSSSAAGYNTGLTAGVGISPNQTTNTAYNSQSMTNNITQNSTFYGGGVANPESLVRVANDQLLKGLATKVRS